MIDFTSFTTIIIIIVVLYLVCSIKILREYERGVIFRWDVCSHPKGPGVILVFAPIDRIVRVTLRTVAGSPATGRDHPRQRDGESERGALLSRVVEPRRAVVEV